MMNDRRVALKLRFSQRLLLLIVLCSLSSFVLEGKEAELTILSLNDTHSHLFGWEDAQGLRFIGGAARWKTIIDEVREEGNEVLVLHAGDFVTGSDANYLVNHQPDWNRLPSYGYRGLLDIPVLHMIGVDAVCLGNHEFDFGLAWLAKILEPAQFPILSANLELFPVPRTDEYQNFQKSIKPYALFSKGDLSVAVIGLTTDEFIKTSQVRMHDPEQSVRDVLATIGPDIDLVVVLSHLGYERDVALAQAVEGIDIIIGGHSHTTLHDPVFAGSTIITQTGAYGAYVGKLDVAVEGGTVTRMQYELIRNDASIAEDPMVSSYLDESLKIWQSDKIYDSDNARQSALGALVTRAMLENTKADIAISMGRLYAGELPAGLVTPESFFSVFWPYQIRSYGPEKDLSPRQVLDIINGIAPRIARTLLPSAKAIANLVHLTVPTQTIDRIFAFNDTLVGTPEFFQIAGVESSSPANDVYVVLDFQSYKLLVEQRVLDSAIPITIEKTELFELVLQALNGEMDLLGGVTHAKNHQ